MLNALTERATRDLRQVIAHTGADDELPADALAETRTVAVTRHLGVRAESDAEQTARVLLSFQQMLDEERPDVVLVAGDTTPALACALATAKLGIAIARLDAGLRCGDWSRPEEVNRSLLDRLSDTLFAHDTDARTILLGEGVPATRIHHAGSTLADLLARWEHEARTLQTWRRYGLQRGQYVLVTLRTAGYATSSGRLPAFARALRELSGQTRVLVLGDAATNRRLGSLVHATDGILVTDAGGYLNRLSLVVGAGAIVTDSGPVQEEASLLGVACHTVGPTTERRATLTRGTNALLGDDVSTVAAVRPAARQSIPLYRALVRGAAGERVAEILVAHYVLRSSDGRGG